jgi:hypothetical protein
MTAYQELPFYPVDTPLTEPDDDPYYPWPQAAKDPMAAVQQRMALVLAASLAVLVLFRRVGHSASSGQNGVATDSRPPR